MAADRSKDKEKAEPAAETIKAPKDPDLFRDAATTPIALPEGFQFDDPEDDETAPTTEHL